jgi:23S rRNA (uracil1939-C5)-methyltransferase
LTKIYKLAFTNFQEKNMTRELILEISAVADQGMALARHGEKVVFIPYGAPGDTAGVVLREEKKNYCTGEIVRLLHPSPLRAAPLCRHYGRCGGCSWQHLRYDAQLAGKNESFRGFSSKRLRLSDDPFLPPVGSPREYGYRNRAALQIDEKHPGVAGFAIRRSHDIFSLEDCPILRETLRKAAVKVPVFLGNNKHRLTRIELQEDLGGSIFGVLYGGKTTPSFMLELAAELGLSGILHRDGGEGFFTGGKRLMDFSKSWPEGFLKIGVTPGNFVQANPEVNFALIDCVRELKPLFEGKTVLDLYCGAGNFTLPLALAAKKVYAVEGYGPSASDASRNALENGLGNVEVIHSPVARALRNPPLSELRPAFCLLDPPRAGCADALPSLAHLSPPVIAYVSCSPPTLVRDLATLQTLGYRTALLRMADMFPQTAHAESFAVLAKEGSAEWDFLTSLRQSA